MGEQKEDMTREIKTRLLFPLRPLILYSHWLAVIVSHCSCLYPNKDNQHLIFSDVV